MFDPSSNTMDFPRSIEPNQMEKLIIYTKNA